MSTIEGASICYVICLFGVQSSKMSYRRGRFDNKQAPTWCKGYPHLPGKSSTCTRAPPMENRDSIDLERNCGCHSGQYLGRILKPAANIRSPMRCQFRHCMVWNHCQVSRTTCKIRASKGIGDINVTSWRHMPWTCLLGIGVRA